MRLTVSDLPKSAVVLPVAGLLAGLFTSFLLTPRYVSTATLAYVERDGEQSPVMVHHTIAEFFIDCEGEILSRTSLSGIIQSPPLNLYPEQRARLPLEDVIETMRRDVKMEIVDRPGYPRDTSTIFQISFLYPEPEKAQQTVQVLITRFAEETHRRLRISPEWNGTGQPLRKRLDELEARVASLETRTGVKHETPPEPVREAPALSFSVLEPASLPERPVFPNRGVLMGGGFGVGLLASLAAVAFRRRYRS